MTSSAPGKAGRVAVVTGASSGIGFVTARALAGMGFRVIAHGRNPGRCESALAEITAAAGGTQVNMLRADISLLSEAKRLAEEIASLTDRIDVLVNNAGGVTDAKLMTAEGNEACFAANHLGPFLLTNILLPLLRKAASEGEPGSVRVITVASSAHEYVSDLDWDDLQSIGNFIATPAYCKAKLANVLFARALADRLTDDGIVSHAMHPGAVDTNFFSYGDTDMQGFGKTQPLISAEEGADTVIWLATSETPGRSSGKYWHERRVIPSSEASRLPDAPDRLWKESEKIVESCFQDCN